MSIIIVIASRFILIELREKNELLRLEAFSNIYAEQLDISAILDKIIDNVFNEYLLLNPAITESNFINEATQNKMVTDISTTVYEELSPSLIMQFSTIVNTDEIPFTKYLSKKCMLKVVSFCAQYNSSIKPN